MTIPQVRQALLTFAEDIGGCDEVEYLAGQLYRRESFRKARKVHGPVDQVAVAAFAQEHPDMSYMDMAIQFDTTIGRISEALAGKRGE